MSSLRRHLSFLRLPLFGAFALSIALLTLGLLGAGCGPRGGTTPRPPQEEAEDDTTLGAGDVFDVRVFGEEDLTSRYRVAQDGTIDFPLVGRIEVATLEPTEIADVIATRLREGGMMIQPQVSVMVHEYNSKRISVLGAVREPGTFPMRSGLTAVQSVSLAGGFTALANRDGTVVSRRVNGEVRRFRVPIDRITNGQEEDFILRAGDIIYVPERLF